MSGSTVILPVKPWTIAKSRLQLIGTDRTRMARAFSLDVLEAVLAAETVDRVVVVTAEAELGATARKAGAVVLVDRPVLDRGILNRAVDAGRRHAQVVAADSPVVVVPGDLAALTGAVLDRALASLLMHPRAFVPDASGLGTTLLAAASPSQLVSSYGPCSALRHSDAGYRPVLDVDARCRRDVDTAIDLAEARRMMVGPHTSAALGLTSVASA